MQGIKETVDHKRSDEPSEMTLDSSYSVES